MMAAPAGAGSASAFPSARHYGWLALGFLALATYGSLVPLDFRPVPWGEAVERYRTAWQMPIRVESRSDWLSNILLFMPAGFLLAGWWAVDRPRMAGLAALIATPAASAALSAAIEFAQVYFPSRTVSPRDVVAETIGGAVGGAAWLLIGPGMTARARARGIDGPGRAAWALPAYLLALMLAHALPLDLTISPGELWGKYKAGMVALVPFAALAGDPAGAARRLADEAASFLVAGLLAGRAAGRGARGFWAVAAMGIALAGLIEAAQLFVASRRFDSTDIFVGAPAFAGGWAAGRAGPEATRARMGLLAAWLALAACSAWSPFDFRASLGSSLARARSVDLLPFADYLRGSAWVMADQVFGKAVLFFPLGMAIGPGRWRGLPAAAGLALVLEAGQLDLPGRQPGLTDVLVEVGGAWAGLSCAGGRTARHRSGGVS